MAMLGNQTREGTMQTYSHVATAGQTSFPCSYGVGASSVFVFQNGVLLSGSDITLTSGNAAVLNVAAAVNDEITIQVQDVFSVADTVSATTGGTFAGNVSMSGTLGVTGAVTASNGLTVDDAGATVLTVDRATSDGTIIDVQKDGTSVGGVNAHGGSLVVGGGDVGIGFYQGANALVPYDQSTNAVRDNAIDLGYASTYRWKDIYLGGGAYIGGTVAANKLDDYEVGTFQMTVAGESSGSARGYGIYVKVANLVHFQWYSGGMTISSATPTLSGLPFTATDPYAGASYSGFVAYHNTYVSNANSGYINLNNSIMYFTALNSTGSPSINTGASKYCMVAGTYHTH